jgi:polysaccharide chain length determinant protein (PEP-CTERM system associated)
MLGHRPLTMEDYVAILKRRWWILALPVLLMPLVAYAVTFFIPPRYLSQTLVLVEQQTVPDDYVKSVVSEDLSGRLASMQEQILSRSRLEPIIERYHLFAGGNADMDDRIAMTRKNITIKPIQSNVERTGGLPGFFITFMASDARTAQSVCGEITSLFVTQNVHSREQSAQDTTDFLKEQLDAAKRSLDEQDAKLAAFQRQYFGKLPDEANSNLSMLTSLNTQMESTTQAIARMQEDKTYNELLLEQQGGQVTTPGGKVKPLQAGQVELQKLQAEEADLKTRYTDDYPDVVALHNKILRLRKEFAEAKPAPDGSGAVPVIAPASSASVQQLQAQIHEEEEGIAIKKHEQAQIQQQISLYQDRVRSSPQVQEKFKELTRDYQTAQKFYDDLLAKMNQSKMATDLERRQQGEQFRVIDQPNLPEQPMFPKRPTFVGGGLAGGLALGLMIIALLEYRDTTLRSERDVFAFTHLPTLAIIGAIPEEPRRVPKRKRASSKPLKPVNEALVSVED